MILDSILFDFATLWTISSSLFNTVAFMPLSRVLIVPSIYKSSGIILLLTPPCMLPMVTTAPASVKGKLLLTIVWSEFTIWAAVTIGSFPVHGVDPWVWTPFKSILNSLTAAIIPSGLRYTCPA